MTSTTTSVLVDTNVFVYARDRSEPVKQKLAVEFTDRLAESGVGRITTQVVLEFYNALTRSPHLRKPRAEAAHLARDLLLSWPTLALSQEVCWRALELASSRQLRVWDAQLIATAAANGVSHVLSEDFEHGRDYAGVVTVDPFADGFDIEALL